MATSTERRRDEVEEAYEIQARAGIRVGLVCIISEGCVAEVELSESSSFPNPACALACYCI